MIWFNIKKLERKIADNDFSDKDVFKYFLAFSILGSLVAYLSTTESFITYIELFIDIIITIWGSYSIYKVNSSGDGQDFFKRFFALSWVIGFRLFLFSLIISIPLVIIYDIISPDSILSLESESDTLSEDFGFMIISSLILLIYYFLLIGSFRRVSSKSN